MARAGIRGWTMHAEDVKGRPDFYFRLYAVAIFVDGCFWHCCPSCGHLPRAHRAFWQEKLHKTRQRDLFEWKKVGAKKQPFLFELRSGEPFAFAGLWEHWGHNGSVIDSCTIITGEPNELAAQVHDRMPVILSPDDYDRWLDPNNTATDQLQSLLMPYPADAMTSRPVSTRVNSARNDGPECVEAVRDGE